MDILNRHIDELELSVRSANGLQNGDILYVGELVQLTEEDLLALRHMGRKSVAELKELLADMGLELDMDVGDWTPPG